MKPKHTMHPGRLAVWILTSALAVSLTLPQPAVFAAETDIMDDAGLEVIEENFTEDDMSAQEGVLADSATNESGEFDADPDHSKGSDSFFEGENNAGENGDEDSGSQDPKDLSDCSDVDPDEITQERNGQDVPDDSAQEESTITEDPKEETEELLPENAAEELLPENATEELLPEEETEELLPENAAEELLPEEPLFAADGPAAAFQDGIYQGSGTGHDGATTVVSVTVSGGRITAIEIIEHGDTAAFMSMASEEMIENIINNQSVDVDVVSGATESSNGIKAAVKDALGLGTQENKTWEAADWTAFQAALDSSIDGDTIRLTADITDGGYNSTRENLSQEAIDAITSATENGIAGVNATANVSKNITIDGDGHSITPASDSEGNSLQCAFYVTADNAEIRNITLNGLNFGNYIGGAVYLQTETDDPTTELTLDNVNFINCSGNKANNRNAGGAVYAESHVSGNGIANNGTPKVNIYNCTFENNTIQSKNGLGRGGAVAGLQADITIENSTFTGNTAKYGGAICIFGENSSLTVNNCFFDASNDSDYGGDDIYIFEGYTWQKTKEQRDSSSAVTLSGNTYAGADGEDFTSWRVMRAGVFGRVTDTANGSIKEYTYGEDYEYKGSGTDFTDGHDAVFDSTDANRTSAPVSDTVFISLEKAATAADIDELTYTGEAQTPPVTVTAIVFGIEKTLTENTDYTVSYENNTNAGTAKAIVTGIGACTGTLEKTFKITAMPVTPTVTLSTASCTYNGKTRTPDVTVNANGRTLKKGTDFTVSYASGRINAGNYKVTVKLKGNYSGTAAANFKITAKKVTPAVTLSTTSCTYNGRNRTPGVTVKVDGKTMKKDTDYTVNYPSSRAKAGTYKVTVKMKGNYSGSAAKSFTIKKAGNPLTVKGKTAVIKYASVKAKTQTIACSKVMTVSKAKGTVTYTKASGTKNITVNTKNGKITVNKGLKKGTFTIKVKVKAAGNANFKAVTKTVLFKITVK